MLCKWNFLSFWSNLIQSCLYIYSTPEKSLVAGLFKVPIDNTYLLILSLEKETIVLETSLEKVLNFGSNNLPEPSNGEWSIPSPTPSMPCCAAVWACGKQQTPKLCGAELWQCLVAPILRDSRAVSRAGRKGVTKRKLLSCLLTRPDWLPLGLRGWVAPGIQLLLLGN